MTNPTKEYYAMPVEGEPVNGDPRGPGKWVALKWPGIVKGYQISDQGQLLSPEGKLLTASLNGRRLYVTLRTGTGSGKGLRVDKLVMGTFVGEPEGTQVPIHLDDNHKNCRLDNLEYGPPSPQELAAMTVNRAKTAKVQAPAPRVRPRTKGTKPKSKADYDHIDVSRLYRHRGTGLSVVVGEDGKAKMPKVSLSAPEMRAMMLLSQRIAEMNEILGLGKQ